MKTICLFNSTEFWGGGEKLHYDIAKGFLNRNYKVFVLAHHKGRLYTECKKIGAEVAEVSVGNLSFLNVFKILELARFFKTNKITAVFFGTSEDVKIGSIAAKIAGVDTIVYWRALATPTKGSLFNKIIFHHFLTHIIANSFETKRVLTQKFASQKLNEKVKVIYYGLDLKEHEQKNTTSSLFEYKNEEGCTLIGNAGRITKQKGQHYFIEIAKILKGNNIKFKILVAGTGDLEEEMKSQITDHGLGNEIEMLGFVSDMNGFMKSIDIFALTSLWEGFGFVIAEAMLHSKPVVAFNTTSNPELIENGNTGLLVQTENAKDFALKLEYLITQPHEMKRMGENGKNRIVNNFEFEAKLTEIENYVFGRHSTQKRL